MGLVKPVALRWVVPAEGLLLARISFPCLPRLGTRLVFIFYLITFVLKYCKNCVAICQFNKYLPPHAFYLDGLYVIFRDPQWCVNPLVDIVDGNARTRWIKGADNCIMSFGHIHTPLHFTTTSLYTETHFLPKLLAAFSFDRKAYSPHYYLTVPKHATDWFDPRTVQPVSSRYTDYATVHTSGVVS